MEENRTRPLVFILKRYKTGVGGVNTRFSFEYANYSLESNLNGVDVNIVEDIVDENRYYMVNINML